MKSSFKRLEILGQFKKIAEENFFFRFIKEGSFNIEELIIDSILNKQQLIEICKALRIILDGPQNQNELDKFNNHKLKRITFIKPQEFSEEIQILENLLEEKQNLYFLPQQMQQRIKMRQQQQQQLLLEQQLQQQNNPRPTPNGMMDSNFMDPEELLIPEQIQLQLQEQNQKRHQSPSQNLGNTQQLKKEATFRKSPKSNNRSAEKEKLAKSKIEPIQGPQMPGQGVNDDNGIDDDDMENDLESSLGSQISKSERDDIESQIRRDADNRQ
eukprot:403368877